MLKQTPRRNLLFLLLPIALLGIGDLAGCKYLPGTDKPNPVVLACARTNTSDYRAEQCAYGLYGQFVAYELMAAAIKEHPSTPESVKASIKRWDAALKPIADSGLDAANEVIKVRREVAAGQNTEERLAIVEANLDRWITDASPKITDFIANVEKL